jgi:uncharacterized protein (TIGR03435 family)
MRSKKSQVGKKRRDAPMTRTLLRAAVAGVIALSIVNPQVRAQSAQATPKFEVASVLPVEPGRRDDHAIEPSPGGLRMRSLNMIGLLMWAYRIGAANQISGGPDWIHTQDFDIAAKATEPVATDQLRLMLQTLLAERFKLVLHRELRIVPLYSLVVDKSGPKIHEVRQEPQSGGMFGWANGVATYKMVNHISGLAAILPAFLEGRPVQDKTGLAGVYDLTLNVEVDPDQMKRMPQVGMTFTGFGYTSGVFDAVKNLGLKLEAAKGPMDFLVIDRVEQPSGN